LPFANATLFHSIPLLVDMEEEGRMKPIVDISGAIFVFIKYNNVYGMNASF
jgi:hypothetical protein